MLRKNKLAGDPQPATAIVEDERVMDIYSGVRWSAMAKYGTQAIEIVVSLIVARIIAPEAYGLLGMAMVILGFLGIFQSLGFGSALIQRKTINETLLSSLFFVTLALGALMAAVLACGSPLASWMYGDPRVGPIVAVLSLSFLLSSPAMVPSALLNRRLAFQRLAWVDITVSLVRGTTVLSLAVAGWGVWSMVWSSLAGAALSTPMMYWAAGWRPRWLFSWSEVRSVFGFGANLTGFSIFNYFARNADNLIIGAFLGPTPLGYYSLAYRILLFPNQAITGVLTRVLFPAFARMQDDDERLAIAYLRACGTIAFVTFPAMIGFAVIARPFVTVVLGTKWLPTVPLIWILAPLGAQQSVAALAGQLFIAKGRADLMFRWGVFAGTVKVGSFLVGLPWGLCGIAIAYTLATVVLDVPKHWLAYKLVRTLSLRRACVVLQPYAITSTLMGIAVALLTLFLPHLHIEDAWVLVATVVAGVVFYLGSTFALRVHAIRDIQALLPVPFRS